MGVLVTNILIFGLSFLFSLEIRSIGYGDSLKVLIISWGLSGVIGSYVSKRLANLIG